MRRTESEWSELRWRAKGTFGLILLGAFFGVVAWLWRDLGGETDLQTLFGALAASGGWRFWVVVVGCAVLGGWLAMLLFWRGRGDDEPEPQDQDGMAGPRF